MEKLTFNDIYTKFYKRSLIFVIGYVRDDMVAEDIVSESLIQLWNTMKNEEVNNPLALLTTILKNKSLNYLKHEEIKRQAFENISSVQARDLNYRILSLEACNPTNMYTEEITRIIHEALKKMSELTKKIFIMSRYKNMSAKDIAEAVGLTIKSVEYHITKALKILREYLKDYLYFLIITYFL